MLKLMDRFIGRKSQNTLTVMVKLSSLDLILTVILTYNPFFSGSCTILLEVSKGGKFLGVSTLSRNAWQKLGEG